MKSSSVSRISLLVLSVSFTVLTNRAVLAADSSATVTEVKRVVVLHPEGDQERGAKEQDLIKGGDVIRTEDRSLAELEFTDKTLVRLGSRSVFTFTPDTRDFHVGKGLTLICLPKGGKGGRIVTAAVTAAIEGTTVLVEEIEMKLEKDGRLRRASKVIFLEGKGQVSHGSSTKPIQGGQMLLQFVDDDKMADVVEVDLKSLARLSGVVKGFKRDLPTRDAIQQIIDRQQADLARGLLERNGLVIGGRGGQRQFSIALLLPRDVPAVNDPAVRDSAILQGAIDKKITPCPSCN